MYFKCVNWLGYETIKKVSLIKGLLILLFPNGFMEKYKRISKKDIKN